MIWGENQSNGLRNHRSWFICRIMGSLIFLPNMKKNIKSYVIKIKQLTTQSWSVGSFFSFISVATMKVHQLEALLVWAQIHKLEIKYTKWPDLFTVYILINHSKENVCSPTSEWLLALARWNSLEVGFHCMLQTNLSNQGGIEQRSNFLFEILLQHTICI